MKTKLTEIKFKSAIGVARQLFSRAACLGTLILIYSSASAQIGRPFATTNPATFIASFSATLNGSLNPHGLPTTFHFQYGRTTNYGLTTPPQTQTGNTFGNVNAHISSLTATATYHFRIVASNADGTRYGSDETFTTLTRAGRPLALTDPVGSGPPCGFRCIPPIILNGTVDPHGFHTTVYFQWGLEFSGYPNTTTPQTKIGNTYQSVSADIFVSTVDGAPEDVSRPYHFRIVATNRDGTSYGREMTFLATSGP